MTRVYNRSREGPSSSRKNERGMTFLRHLLVTEAMTTTWESFWRSLKCAWYFASSWSPKTSSKQITIEVLFRLSAWHFFFPEIRVWLVFNSYSKVLLFGACRITFQLKCSCRTVHEPSLSNQTHNSSSEWVIKESSQQSARLQPPWIESVRFLFSIWFHLNKCTRI